MQELPILDNADQQFGVIFDNRRVTLRVRYNPTSDRWSFDLSIDDVPVLTGRRIVTGVDLLRSFNLGIGMLFALPTASTDVPGRTELPNGVVRLYYSTVEEYEAAVGTIS